MRTTTTRRNILQSSTILMIAGTLYSGSSEAQESGSNWNQYRNDIGNSGFVTDSNIYGESGSIEWTQNITEPITSEITVGTDNVYLSDDIGRVYEVASEGVSRIFEFVDETITDPDTDLPTPTPVVDDDTIYIADLTGQVSAVDLETGDTEWSHTEMEVPIQSSPLLYNNRLIVVNQEGFVQAFRADTGEPQWFTDVGDTRSTPVVFDDNMYICDNDGNIHQNSLTEPGTLQVGSMGSEFIASPVSTENGVCAIASSGDIVALNSSGQQWENSLTDPVEATPAVGNGMLCVGTVNGTAIGIETDTGDQVWKLKLEGNIQNGIAYAGGIAVYPTDTGYLYGIDTDSEEIRWRLDIGAEINTPVSISGDTIYCGDTNGQIYAVTARGNPANTSTSGSKNEVSNQTDGSVLTAVGGVVSLGTVGALSYYTVGKWLSEDQPQPTTDDVETNEITTSLSNDVAPINDTNLGTATKLGISDARYEDFKKIETIGSGGNADIYKVNYTKDDIPNLALKVPRGTEGETVDVSAFDEFIEEAEIWESIDQHPRIVDVHSWGKSPLPWIAVEYMEHGDLTDQILDQKDIFAELEGFCEGLHHAHSHGVTHTDIKPNNILYTEVDGEKIGKFTDWGLANVLLEHSMSVEGLTPEYSAPEQFSPDKYGRTDEQTDIYQLGIVAYELFTGELPHTASSQGETVMSILNDKPPTPSEVNPELPAELDQVIMKALAKSKEDRYETILHFRDSLQQVYHRTYSDI